MAPFYCSLKLRATENEDACILMFDAFHDTIIVYSKKR